MNIIIFSSLSLLLFIHGTTSVWGFQPTQNEDGSDDNHLRSPPAKAHPGMGGRGIFDMFNAVPIFGPIISGMGSSMMGGGKAPQQQGGGVPQFSPEQIAYIQQQQQQAQQQQQPPPQQAGQQQMTQEQYQQLLEYQRAQQAAAQGG